MTVEVKEPLVTLPVSSFPCSDTMNEMPSFDRPAVLLLTIMLLLTRAVPPVFTTMPNVLLVVVLSSTLITAAALATVRGSYAAGGSTGFGAVAMALPLTTTPLPFPLAYSSLIIARPAWTTTPPPVLL